MDEKLDFILDRVTRHDQERSVYKEMAERWVSMWKLDPGFQRPLKEAIAKGMEQVILPTPFNVVNLSQRLLSATPKIDVIPQDVGDKESEEYAEQCEKWLTAMWRQVNKAQGRNVLSDNVWNALVYGRFVFDVRWVRDMLPTDLKKTSFPISIRTLPPTNVGIQQGPYATEFAYHKYEASVLEVIRAWPKLKNVEITSALGRLIEEMRLNNGKTEDRKVCVIDYWETHPVTGKVYNAVLVEDEFAKPLKVTSYPYVPIICGRGDYAVGLGDEFDGLSILHSIDGLWQYQCRLASQLATGLMWYFWPQFLISNEYNTPVGDFSPKPGGVEEVPYGTKVDQVKMDPNVPLAETVYQKLEASIQQSTYPEVMFGMMPQDLKSSYGIALLSDAAQGRIKNFQESLEMAIERVNELCLALVERKGGEEGVSIWGVSEHDEKYRLILTPEMIDGVYHNEVSIVPAMPTDDMQKTVQGKQLADSKYISVKTLHDKYLGINVPSDEMKRIAVEEAMQSDEMRNYRLRRAMEDYFGEDALSMMMGTDLMPQPPEGYEWYATETGKVEMRKLPEQPPQAPQPPPGLSGMPPGQPDPMSGGLPPGLPGMPPGGPPIQPPGVAGPQGGGIPPQLAGQLSAPDLGLPTQTDPMLMDMILNNQGSPNDVMNQTIGVQP